MVKLFAREPGRLIGIAYGVADRLSALMEAPSAKQCEQMRHGEVTITNLDWGFESKLYGWRGRWRR